MTEQERRKEITKPHSVITARMTLTAKEQDLLSLLIMKVKESSDSHKFERGVFDPNKPESLELITTFFEFDVKDLSEILGLPVKTLKKQKRCTKTGKLQPSALEKACQAIRNQDVRIRTEKGFVGRRLVSDAVFDAESGILSLETTRTMAAIMLDYGQKNDSFGKTDMRLFFSLNGAFEKRILELISRFKNERDYRLTLGEFCETIDVLPSKYSTMANFRKSVLEKPIARIIKASGGMWETQEDHPKGFFLKRGAKPNDLITFKMKYNSPNTKIEKKELITVDPIAVAFEAQIRAGVDAVIGIYLQYITENNLSIPEDIQEMIDNKPPKAV